MNFSDAVKIVRDRCIADGRPQDIPSKIAKLKKIVDTKRAVIDHDLAYLVDADRDGYIHDMQIAQSWAALNRKTIASQICNAMGWSDADSFSTVHNYLGFDGIIRKSAISAKKGQKVLIPLNMRDGSIIGIGKGNDDWNCSAPHGAGRLMSRTAAKKAITLDAYADSMKNVYTTSVCDATIDEAPMAYKPSDKIVQQIADTVDVIDVIKPSYNFKASD